MMQPLTISGMAKEDVKLSAGSVNDVTIPVEVEEVEEEEETGSGGSGGAGVRIAFAALIKWSSQKRKQVRVNKPPRKCRRH